MTSHPADHSGDELSATQGYNREEEAQQQSDDRHSPLPERIGRYIIRGELGRGGFADVLLAHDEELDRQIALKLPRRDRFQGDDQLQAFVEEARTAACLQHPGIVTVFDVGNHENTPFIVLEYIRGRSLSHLLKHESLSFTATAQLVAETAEALAHAHDHGFVHRDIKPQNILLDTDDRPHVADFGLAVRHRESIEGSDELAGTTQYMSPEQVRGENHRLDGRTDIWALGVVFYRMLTGRLAFVGASPQEVFQQILYTEPVPPRQFDPTIPAELERICLRCLCRQMSERYRSAADLSDDLAAWVRFTTGGSGSSLRRRPGVIEPPDAPVVPRGLRSFDQEDVDFFLKLIPGPRDRDGLPAVIRFWKNRIDERESDETFRVGLLYGPSGCGKSSLVKAGLLPRLGSDITHLYVDATSRDTEARLLRALHRKFKQLSHELDLPDAIRELRERGELRSDQKILIVLDQFEQWLHTWQSGSNAELVRALRQCDGGNVQCVLMVRDDFWLPVSRFMRQLEISIIDGVNGMLVDSFDPDHARRVLREFGVAYDRLPENSAEQTEEQTAFLEQATTELAQENRLYPVRLAVFVEMVKDREWLPATLDEMGGTEGVGVAFLENSVGSRASQARRVHEQAARNVLSALLPQSGQIKDSARTRSELLETSQYAERPQDFDELMHLLDVELRLLTPARSPDEETRNQLDDDTARQPSRSEMVYQLTHDFLVPSIREWLQRQMRGTRRGRARLLLEEQAKLWNSRPSRRFLPSLSEWIGLRLRTKPREWTKSQHRMMKAAGQRIARRTLVLVVCLLIGAAAVFAGYRSAALRRNHNEAQTLVSRLQSDGIDDVPDLIAKMEPYRDLVNPLLRETFLDESLPERDRIRAGIALLPDDDDHVEWLTGRLVSEQRPPEDFPVVRSALQDYKARVSALLHNRLQDDTLPPRRRFRMACALAAFDSSSDIWQHLAPEVTASLLREPAPYASIWIEALGPVSKQLRQPLFEAVNQTTTLESARIGTLALFDFDDERTNGLIELLAEAKGPRYRAVVELLGRSREGSLELARDKLAELSQQNVEETDLELQAKRKANLTLALFELGDASLLNQESKLKSDPRVRTRLVHGMNPERMDLSTLLPLILDKNTDQPMQNVAMRAAWRHLDDPLSTDLKIRIKDRLIEIYLAAEDSAAHSVAGLLLRKLGVNLDDQDRRLSEKGRDASSQWFIDKAGLTMLVLDPRSLDIAGYEAPSIGYAFAISSTEITLEQLRTVVPGHSPVMATVEGADGEVPASGVMLVDAARYCNRLSKQNQIAESQWCYPPEEQLKPGQCDPFPDYLDRLGYRLPTEDEWEFACRSGSRTSRFYGETPEFLCFYAWGLNESGGLLHPVAQLLPNAFGVSDTYGNVQEMCVTPADNAFKYTRRGSDCYGAADVLTSDSEFALIPTAELPGLGFRVVQTIRYLKHGE
jgi:serine/threonine protein kinase